MQGPVFSLKQLLIGAPRRLIQVPFFGPYKEIAALQRERSALPAIHPSPHGILPVRGMERHFPDVVAAGSGTPRGLLRGYSLDGLLEIWSMPGFFLVGFIKQHEHELCGIHGASSWGVSEKESALYPQPERRGFTAGWVIARE